MSPLLSEQMMAKLRLSPQAYGHARSPGRTQEMSALRHCHCFDNLRAYESGELKEGCWKLPGLCLVYGPVSITQGPARRAKLVFRVQN